MQQHPGLQLRNGWWYCNKVIRGGQRKKRLREATGCREAEAEKAVEYLENRIKEVEEYLSEDTPTVEHTFQDASVEYVLHLERRGKDPARAELDLDLLDPHVGTLPLSHVHQGALTGFDVAMQGHRRSSTVARAYRTATAVLNHAARVLRDGNKPWLSQAVPKLIPPDWQDQLPPYRLTWQEQDTLLGILGANTRRKHLVAPVLFGLSTGARQQEICQLQWSWEMQINGLPKGAVWSIPAEVRKSNARKTASAQRGRYLVCNAMARSVIDGQRDNACEYVFPGPSGRHLGVLNNSGWRTAWEMAKLPMTGVKRGIHNLRHTFGERMDAAGVPWQEKKALLGHEIGDVTAIYSQPGLARLLEWAEKITRDSTPVLRPVSEIRDTNVTQRKKAV